LSVTTEYGELRITGLDSKGNGEYELKVEYELTSAMEHDGDENDASLSKSLPVITITNEGGGEATASIGLTVWDDVPERLELDQGRVENNFEGEIDFDAGQDGFGGIEFKASVNGSLVKDTDGNRIQLDGKDLVYHTESNGKLTAQTADGAVGFEIQLSGESYHISKVAAGLGIAAQSTTYTSYSGPDKKPENYKVFESEASIIQVTAMAANGTAEKVNGSAPGFGVKQPFISKGEVLRLDFFNKAEEVSQAERSQVKKVDLSLTQASKGADIYVDLIRSDAKGYEKAFENTGVSLGSDAEVTFKLNGSVVAAEFVAGKGWKLQINKVTGNKAHSLTVESNEPFDAIHLGSANGDYRVSLPQNVVIEDTPASSDVCLEIPVVGSDGDGDTIEGILPLTLDCGCGSGAPVETAPFIGTVSGTEDTALSITWFDLVGEANPTAQSITYVGSEGGGQLLLNGKEVVAGTEITKQSLLDGQLTFVPAENESGFDGYAVEGIGDQKTDYAHIKYTIVGVDSSQQAELTIDIKPVADNPEVHITITSKSAPELGAEVIEVNGGSKSPDGLGFDVLDGKVVAIGENVRIWYTDAKTGSTKRNDVKHVQDLSAEDINTILANSLKGLTGEAYAQAFNAMKANFVPYTTGNPSSGNAGKQVTDVFMLHENSLYQQNVQVDNQGTTYHAYKINGGKGNGGKDNAPDFIFLLESTNEQYKVSGVVSHEWHEQEYNHNDNWTIKTDAGAVVTQGFNQLAGVITSSGGYIGNPGLVAKPTEAADFAEYDIHIVAHVSDLDGSEGILADLVLSGLPAGAQVVHKGEVFTVESSGQLTLQGDLSNYPLALGTETQVTADITVRVPADSIFSLEVEAHAYERVLGTSETATGHAEQVISSDITTEDGEVPSAESQAIIAVEVSAAQLIEKGTEIHLGNGAQVTIVDGTIQLEGIKLVEKGAAPYWNPSDPAVIHVNGISNGNRSSIDGVANANPNHNAQYILLEGEASRYEMSVTYQNAPTLSTGYYGGVITDKHGTPGLNQMTVNHIKGFIFTDGTVIENGSTTTSSAAVTYEHDLTISLSLSSDVDEVSLSHVTVELTGLEAANISGWAIDGLALHATSNPDGTITLVLPEGLQTADIKATIQTDSMDKSWAVKASATALVDGVPVGEMATDITTSNDVNSSTPMTLSSFALIDEEWDAFDFDGFASQQHSSAEPSISSVGESDEKLASLVMEDLISDHEVSIDSVRLASPVENVDQNGAVTTDKLQNDNTVDDIASPSETDIKVASDLFKDGGGFDQY